MNVSALVRSRGLKAVSALMMTLALVMPSATAMAVAQPRDYDNNAVMYGGAYSVSEFTTKYKNGDGRNSAGNLQNIYRGFGINADNVRNVVNGSVTKDGRVIVNGKVVATNVWTSGRQPMDNSTAMNGVYLRPPAVSFLNNSLDAFVNMEGGTFRYAIVKACGNPVYPQNKPFGQIYKRVMLADGSTEAADDRAHAVTQKHRAEFKYTIVVTNNGHAPMTNVVITDDLPAGVELISNPGKRRIEANLGTINVGSGKAYTLTMRVTSKTNGQYINNNACFTADRGQKGCNNAYIKVSAPAPKDVTPVTERPVVEQPVTERPVVEQQVTERPRPVAPVTETGRGEEEREEETTPTTLVETGAGALGVLTGMGAIGYTASNYLRSRRALRDSVRK